MKKKLSVDMIFFWITLILMVIGLFMFLSAAFSAIGNTEKFHGVLFNQLVLGYVGGGILGLILYFTPLEYIKKYAPWMYALGVILLVLVFIPHVGIAHGGAKRWISVLGFSFQPVEFVKYATVIYVAAWLSVIKQKIKNIPQGLLPFALITGVVGVLLLIQPDTDSFLMMFAACFVMYFIAGAKWRDMGIMVLVGLVAGGGLLFTRPYLLSRVQVFLDPSRDPLGTSYQVQQQLIALGSGRATGRGFGQSVQKFKYLPEPMSDSIFSVIGEELGFLGATIIVVLYLLFFLRGMMIALRLKDSFSKYLVVGIVSTITFQVLLNIASNVALFPLSGLPLIFMSQGGTALAFSLGALGLVLNASRQPLLPQVKS